MKSRAAAKSLTFHSRRRAVPAVFTRHFGTAGERLVISSAFKRGTPFSHGLQCFFVRSAASVVMLSLPVRQIRPFRNTSAEFREKAPDEHLPRTRVLLHWPW